MGNENNVKCPHQDKCIMPCFSQNNQLVKLTIY